MTVFGVIALLILFLLISIDCWTEATFKCKCGKEFTSTFTGATFLFDYHYIVEHLMKRK